jgi:hypothetical protein
MMTKILEPVCKPIFHLAGGSGAIWHPVLFLPAGGPFWVGTCELKLQKLTRSMLLHFTLEFVSGIYYVIVIVIIILISDLSRFIDKSFQSRASL